MDTQRIRMIADIYLKGLLADFRDLPDLEDDWRTMPARERDSFSYSWQIEVVDNDFPALERYHQAGELTEEQERRYKELKDELRREWLPIIERLGLAMPREILDG